MTLQVIRIGNSRGIRIPKKILDQCRITGSMRLSIKGRKIVLEPIDRKPREQWADAAKAMHENGDDELLIPDVLDDDIDVEWR